MSKELDPPLIPAEARETPAHVARSLANSLPDLVLESVRDVWGNTNVAVIKHWRDAVLALPAPDRAVTAQQETPDPVCEHGTAMDVHCCGCHSGFLFDIDSCVCLSPVEAMHAAAPEGYKCSDCTIDRETCPTCYAAWWKRKHPHHEVVQPSAVTAPQAQESTPVIAAGLLTMLKEECEAQHARAEKAESELKALRAALLVLVGRWREEARELDDATHGQWVEPGVKGECADDLQRLLEAEA